MGPLANETSGKSNPIGIYHQKESDTTVGCIDPIQADAAVRLGYKLVKEYATAAEVTEAAKETTKESPKAPLFNTKESE